LPNSLQLQVAPSDMLSVALVGVAVIAIALIYYVIRRRAARMPELSKGADEKIEALVPKTTLSTQGAFGEKNARPQVLRTKREERRFLESSNHAPLKTELDLTRARLQQLIRDMTTMKEREASLRIEIDSLKGEARFLRERLLSNAQEIEKLRTTAEEQNIKIQNQRRDIELQRREMKETENRRSPRLFAVRTLLPQPEREPIQPHIPLKPMAEAQPELPLPLSTTTQPKICPNCTRQVGPQDLFCDGCGYRIVSYEPTGTATGNRRV
jgi:hypothetical protein